LTMSELTDRALAFATECHKGQVRKWGEKGAPYIVHPMRVAEVAMRDGMKDGAVAAAYLHDVIEDCGVNFSTLKENFGEDVAMLVDELTSASKKLAPEELAKMSREQRKKYDRDHLRDVSQTAKILKCIDRTDNLTSLHNGRGMDHDFFLKYVFESVQLYQTLYRGSTRRMRRYLLMLEGAIADLNLGCGNLTFELICVESYREFICPVCQSPHMANVKARRYRKTDSVLCEGCQRTAPRPLSRMLKDATLNREERIRREEERMMRVERQEKMGTMVTEEIMEARAARRKEFETKCDAKWPYKD